MSSIPNRGAKAPLKQVFLKPGTPLANIYAIQASFPVSFIYTENILGLQDSFAGVPGKTLALSYLALPTWLFFVTLSRFKGAGIYRTIHKSQQKR